MTTDPDLVAAMAGMVAAAGRLATVADPVGPLDEVLALDEVWFHVLYPIGSPETGPQVAYLLLERNVANLAAARREFRTLVQAVPASQPGPTSSSEETTTPATTPHAADRPAFPRRVAAIPTEPGALPEDRTFGDHTRWLNQAAGPFVSDERTLRRLLEALRQL
ncbi:hypothetical protein [Micromonospora polyrhachis]|uniref:Uncharacterized protein n=1 Tax=Micromonospora polyrhachis TaxID=1282883 RepID=A0A7W7SQR6_9ACTN|nr:hypothetical protein [Micromonospora polyrhachis]MBB4959230.1 hypothetical protein [Micromonospora polyrhachis]